MARIQKNMYKNQRVFLFLTIIAILLSINALQFYFTYTDKKKAQEQLQNREGELIVTFVKLDSISDAFEDKIEEMRRLNGNVDSLLTIRDQLQQEKIDLQNAQRITQDRYNQIRAKMGSYEVLLKKKEKEIADLKGVNNILFEDSYALKARKQELDKTVRHLKEVSGKLEEKIDVASALSVSHFELIAENKRSKQRKGKRFKINHLQILRVKFSLAANSLAKPGKKEILLRIISPDGTALYNLTAGSDSFSYKGEKIFYTKKKQILYDTSGGNFEFVFEKGTAFKKGKHLIELYNQGTKIGTTDFEVE